MDVKRFAWVVLILALGVLGLLYMARKQQGGGEPAGIEQPRPAADPAQAQPQTTELEAPTVRPAETVVAAPAARSGRREWAHDVNRSRKLTIGSVDPESPFPFQVEFVTHGAAINTVKLARHFATVADKRLYSKYKDDPAGYAQALAAAAPGTYQGHYSLLNPVRYRGKTYHPLATHRLAVEMDGQTFSWRLDGQNWKVHSLDTDGADGRQSITFSYVLYRDYNYDRPGSQPDEREFLTLMKTYSIRQEDHSVAVSLEVINRSGRQISVTVDQYGPTGVPREDLRADQRKAKYAYYRTADMVVDPAAKPIQEIAPRAKQGFGTGESIPLGRSDDAVDPMLWVGLTNKFFGSMLYLRPLDPDRLAAASYKANFYLVPAYETEGARTFLTGVQTPSVKLPAGSAVKLNFDLFAGPKRVRMFSNPEARYYKKLYEKLDYRSTVDLRGCAWAPLAYGVIWMLQKLSWLALGNYGVAIIVLVVLVRICLHPLTKKGQISMMKMQKMGPQTQALKEKYKDDKESLNREMMRMYKEQGASPLLGCLPMLLQLPIWIALFSALNASVDLRHAAFLPAWITDLAAPDALFGPWKDTIALPILSSVKSFNLLPILVTVAMYLQTKMNPTMSAQASASPEQAQQQKMMKYMMPLMMLMFFYNAPSGLNLYIMTSMFAGVAEQVVIRRHIRARQAAEAAAETRVTLPGKAPRSARPRKPKGPFWVKRG